MIVKPPSFSGKGYVMTFLAILDNCRQYNGWTEKEIFHYLTNALKNPVAQLLWDLQSCIAVSYKKLGSILVSGKVGVLSLWARGALCAVL